MFEIFEELKSFIILGSRNIKIRKEKEKYTFFCPKTFQCYGIDEDSAFFLYMIANNIDISKQYEIINNIYNLNKHDYDLYIYDLLSQLPILNYIMVNLEECNIDVVGILNGENNQES